MPRNLNNSPCYAERVVTGVHVLLFYTNTMKYNPRKYLFGLLRQMPFLDCICECFSRVNRNECLCTYLSVSEYICECVFVFTQAQRRSPPQMKSKMTGQHCSLSEHERARECV